MFGIIFVMVVFVFGASLDQVASSELIFRSISTCSRGRLLWSPEEQSELGEVSFRRTDYVKT